jgi:hypothetical protein
MRASRRSGKWQAAVTTSILVLIAAGVTARQPPSSPKTAANVPAAASAPASGPAVEFEFSLDKPALTSAGVYDANDRLVRVLWTMKDSPAGRQVGQWDGQDEFGQPALPGQYRWRAVLNGARYVNVGIVGRRR